MSRRGLFLIRCKELFYGDANGSLCRMVTREGGRLGPDVISVCGFPQEYESLTVDTADGKEIKGVTLNEDNFSVQVMDISEGERPLRSPGPVKSFVLIFAGECLALPSAPPTPTRCSTDHAGAQSPPTSRFHPPPSVT